MSTHTEDLRAALRLERQKTRYVRHQLETQERANDSIRKRMVFAQQRAQRARVWNLALGAVALLAVVFALAFSGGPARAASEHPTPVMFTAVHGVSESARLKLTMPDGDHVRQRLGTTVEHPEKVCPPNKAVHLTWSYYERPARSEVHVMKPGACTRPGPGPVFVEAWRSAAAASASVTPTAAGTTVYFNVLEVGIPKTIDLRNTSVTGHRYLQAYQTKRNNVHRTCPKAGYRLSLPNDSGGRYYLDVDQCKIWLTAGVKSVGMHRP